MHGKPDSSFYITDPDKIPEPYKGLQADLSAAIVAFGESVKEARTV
jgi:hypothetical protein